MAERLRSSYVETGLTATANPVFHCGAGERNRTPDLLITKAVSGSCPREGLPASYPI